MRPRPIIGRVLVLLIAPYVQQETPGYTQLASTAGFGRALDELVQHAHDRYDAVVDYLAAP
jgi:spore coat protein H